MRKIKICPYLGMLDDADTPLLYSSKENWCNRSRPRPVTMKYQDAVCLKEDHKDCPAFLDAAKTNQVPFSATGYLRKNARLLRIIFFVVVILGLGYLYVTRYGFPTLAEIRHLLVNALAMLETMLKSILAYLKIPSF